MGLVSILLFLGLVAFYWDNNRLRSDIGGLTARLEQVSTDCFALKTEREGLLIEIEKQKEANSKVLSAKISSEVKLGNCVEQLAPFLESCKYRPQDMHFLGTGIDYVVYNIDAADPAIIFLEVKSQGAKLSKKQRVIKELIKKGAVRFEEMRVSDKGQSIKVTKNDE